MDSSPSPKIFRPIALGVLVAFVTGTLQGPLPSAFADDVKEPTPPLAWSEGHSSSKRYWPVDPTDVRPAWQNRWYEERKRGKTPPKALSAHSLRQGQIKQDKKALTGLEERFRGNEAGKAGRREFVIGTSLTAAVLSLLYGNYRLGQRSRAPAPTAPAPSAPTPPEVSLLAKEWKELANDPLLQGAIEFFEATRITGPTPNLPWEYDFTGLSKSYLELNETRDAGDRGALLRAYGVDSLEKLPPQVLASWTLSHYGRIWTYDAALNILLLLKAGRPDEAREAVNALVGLAKKEKEMGALLWHFSYNTNGDGYIDPRQVTGANAWALQAIYAYILQTGETTHLAWANQALQNFFFRLQVMEKTGATKEDPRYGLVQFMMHNPTDYNKRPGEGYSVYRGSVNTIDGNISAEHNANVARLYRLAAQVNTAFPTQKGQGAQPELVKELAARHELVMQGLKKLWAGDHFVTGMHMTGLLNSSVAVDNNTWVAQVFLPYDPELVWQAIQYTKKNFLTELPVEQLEGLKPQIKAKHQGKKVKGLFFFPKTYSDIAVQPNPAFEQMIQPEATLGYIHLLKQYADQTADENRRREALELARELYQNQIFLRDLYGGPGLPYATKEIAEFFNTLQGAASTYTGGIVTAILQGKPDNDFLGVIPPASFTIDGKAPGVSTHPTAPAIPSIQAKAPSPTQPVPSSPAQTTPPASIPTATGRMELLHFSEDSATLRIPGAQPGWGAAAFLRTDQWYVEPYAGKSTDQFHSWSPIQSDGTVTVRTLSRSPFVRGKTAVVLFKSAQEYDAFMQSYRVELGLGDLKGIYPKPVEIYIIDERGSLKKISGLLRPQRRNGELAWRFVEPTPARFARWLGTALPLGVLLSQQGPMDRRRFFGVAGASVAAAAAETAQPETELSLAAGVEEFRRLTPTQGLPAARALKQVGRLLTNLDEPIQFVYAFPWTRPYSRGPSGIRDWVLRKIAIKPGTSRSEVDRKLQSAQLSLVRLAKKAGFENYRIYSFHSAGKVAIVLEPVLEGWLRSAIDRLAEVHGETGEMSNRITMGYYTREYGEAYRRKLTEVWGSFPRGATLKRWLAEGRYNDLLKLISAIEEGQRAASEIRSDYPRPSPELWLRDPSWVLSMRERWEKEGLPAFYTLLDHLPAAFDVFRHGRFRGMMGLGAEGTAAPSPTATGVEEILRVLKTGKSKGRVDASERIMDRLDAYLRSPLPQTVPFTQKEATSLIGALQKNLASHESPVRRTAAEALLLFAEAGIASKALATGWPTLLDFLAYLNDKATLKQALTLARTGKIPRDVLAVTIEHFVRTLLDDGDSEQQRAQEILAYFAQADVAPEVLKNVVPTLTGYLSHEEESVCYEAQRVLTAFVRAGLISEVEGVPIIQRSVKNLGSRSGYFRAAPAQETLTALVQAGIAPKKLATAVIPSIRNLARTEHLGYRGYLDEGSETKNLDELAKETLLSFLKAGIALESLAAAWPTLLSYLPEDDGVLHSNVQEVNRAFIDAGISPEALLAMAPTLLRYLSHKRWEVRYAAQEVFTDFAHAGLIPEVLTAAIEPSLNNLMYDVHEEIYFEDETVVPFAPAETVIALLRDPRFHETFRSHVPRLVGRISRAKDVELQYLVPILLRFADVGLWSEPFFSWVGRRKAKRQQEILTVLGNSYGVFRAQVVVSRLRGEKTLSWQAFHEAHELAKCYAALGIPTVGGKLQIYGIAGQLTPILEAAKNLSLGIALHPYGREAPPVVPGVIVISLGGDVVKSDEMAVLTLILPPVSTADQAADLVEQVLSRLDRRLRGFEVEYQVTFSGNLGDRAKSIALVHWLSGVKVYKPQKTAFVYPGDQMGFLIPGGGVIEPSDTAYPDDPEGERTDFRGRVLDEETRQQLLDDLLSGKPSFLRTDLRSLQNLVAGLNAANKPKDDRIGPLKPMAHAFEAFEWNVEELLDAAGAASLRELPWLGSPEDDVWGKLYPHLAAFYDVLMDKGQPRGRSSLGGSFVKARNQATYEIAMVFKDLVEKALGEKEIAQTISQSVVDEELARFRKLLGDVSFLEAGLEEFFRRDFLRTTGLAAASVMTEGFSSPIFVQTPPDLTPAALLERIKKMASQALFEDGLRFLDRQRISGRGRVMPVNLPAQALARYQRERSRPFQGFNMNGLYRSYIPDESNSQWEAGAKYLAKYGRVHIYDTSLGILADLAAGRINEAREAVYALIELGKEEEALGFTGGWHFSYNTIDDSWLDPRGPMGGNLWAMKAIYEYIRAALKDPQLRGEALRHLDWVNKLVKRLVFEMQVMHSQDTRYGLVRAMKYNSLLDVMKPGAGRPYNLDEIGYRAYEGNPNKISEHVIFEHNADAADLYRLAALVTQEAKFNDPAFLKELASRHELLLNALWEKAWVGDHYVTAMEPNGRLNESVAVDNNTWLAQVFLPYDEQRAWAAIEYVWREFRSKDENGRPAEKVKDLILEDLLSAIQGRYAEKPFAGLYFFNEGFADPFVEVPAKERPKLGQMVQPEATFGYIHFLIEFALVTKDAKKKEEALKRAQLFYQSMELLQEMYGQAGPRVGLPYATLFVHGYFNSLRGMAPTASGSILTARMRGSPVGFIGVDPPASFTFQGRKPGERPAPQPAVKSYQPAPKELKETFEGLPGGMHHGPVWVEVGPGTPAFLASRERLPDETLLAALFPAYELGAAGMEELGGVRSPAAEAPPAAQVVQPLRFIVDTKVEGEPKVLDLLRLAVQIHLEDPKIPIQAAGVATEMELAIAQAELPTPESRRLLEDLVYTYTPGDEGSYRAARWMAQASIENLHPENIITKIDRTTIAWFDEAIRRLGIWRLSRELQDRIEAFATAA